MYCKKCGKKLEPDAVFCPYCGTKQSEPGAEKNPEVRPETNPEAGPETDPEAGPETESTGPKGVPRGLIIGLAAAACAVVVVIAAMAGVRAYRSNGNGGTVVAQVVNRPKLSATNVEAANKVIEIVDKYLDTSSWEAIAYGSETAIDDLLEAKQSLIVEADEATEAVRQEIIDYIDKIVEELDLNEKSLSNAARILEGGETADREAVQEYRDEIERLVEKYS